MHPFQEALKQIAQLQEDNAKLKEELSYFDKHCYCDKADTEIAKQIHHNDILAEAIPAMSRFTNKLRKENKKYAKSK